VQQWQPKRAAAAAACHAFAETLQHPRCPPLHHWRSPICWQNSYKNNDLTKTLTASKYTLLLFLLLLLLFVQIAITVMHVGRVNVSSEWLSIAAAVQCILLLFRLQYFSRVFTPTNFAFVDDLKGEWQATHLLV